MAWYNTGTEAIYISDDQKSGDVVVEWVQLTGGRKAPKIEAFSDAWEILAESGDMLDSMKELAAEDVSQDNFVLALRKLGFVDLTEYSNPKELENLNRRLESIREEEKKITKRIKQIEDKAEKTQP